MKCTQCGKEIPEGSKFCNSCGAKIETETPKEKQTEQRSTSFTSIKEFLIEKKEWLIGYAVWFVVNFSFLLLGSKGHNAKRAFFPFNGELSEYDSSEFFVYVVAIPVVVYAAYYFYQSYYVKKKAIRLPKISPKIALICLPLAVLLSLIVYATAMKPVEHYEVTNNYNSKVGLVSRSVFMDVAKAEIPSFLGDTYMYNPYRHFFSYRHYPLHSLNFDEKLYYPKMPLLFRLRVAIMIMCSWKGLRFIILMWVLLYGIQMFINPRPSFFSKRG